MSLEWTTQSPDGWFKKLQDIITKRPCNLARKIFSEAVKGTPVRTGQLRASWTLSRNTPDFLTVDAGGADGAPLPPPVTPDCQRGEVYVVANGKPYAGFIENGSPTTMPVKMLAKAIQKATIT